MADLEQLLVAIASRELGHPAPPSTLSAVREAINNHELWLANAWLLPLLQDVLDGKVTTRRIEIPSDYPSGESGLANALADLDGEPWLSVEDDGEMMIWQLRQLRLEVTFDRTSRTTYLISPDESAENAILTPIWSSLAEVMDTSAFRSAFPRARLLRSAHEIRAVRQSLSPALLPFMAAHQPDSVDIFAIDLADPQRRRIVVWNDHAVVMDWESVEHFACWIENRGA